MIVTESRGYFWYIKLTVMKSKIVAVGILLFVFLVPFRMAYLSDQIANSASFIFEFLGTLIGFLVAFGIGTNEPFDRKKEKRVSVEYKQEEIRKAA